MATITSSGLIVKNKIGWGPYFTAKAFIFLIALVSGNAIAALESLLPIEESEPCGEGPVRVITDTGIRLRPLNDVQQDVENLNWAVSKTPSGGVLELCEGIFNLGEGKQKEAITINKGITIEGKYFDSDWQTIIYGGGDIQIKLTPPSLSIGSMFVFNTEDSEPNVFDKIWFRNWTAEAITTVISHGLTVSNSKFTDSYAGTYIPILKSSFSIAVYAYGFNSGDYNLVNNVGNFQDYLGRQPSDSQLMAIAFSAWSNISISSNRVVTNDEAFEIFLSGNSKGTNITIEDNDIDVNVGVDGNWPLHFAIIMTNNFNIESATVRNNSLLLKNSMEKNIGDAGAFLLTGYNLLVEGNDINFDNFGGALLQTGLDEIWLNVPLGNSLRDSVVGNNSYSGVLDGPSYKFSKGNNSNDNTFTFTDDLLATGSSALLDASDEVVCGNSWEGPIPADLAVAIEACGE